MPEEQERVIHVSAEGVSDSSGEFVSSAPSEVAQANEAPVPENEFEQLEGPVPVPKMRIGVLVAAALLVIVFVVYYAVMQLG